MKNGDKLSKELRKLRDAKGESQGAIAKKIGVSRATLNRWEGHGAGTVTIDQLEKLGTVLEAEPSAMISPQGVALMPELPTKLLPALLELATLLPAMHEGEIETLLVTARTFAGPRDEDEIPLELREQSKKAR